MINEEKKVFFSHLNDLERRAYEKNVIQCSDFLTVEEGAYCREMFRTALLWGGFEGAERCVAVFLPEYLGADDIRDDPSLCGLSGVRISLSKYDLNGKIGHRDVLGALMNLGIERDVVGDIICSDAGASAVVKKKIASHIINELKQVGRHSVTVEECSPAELCPHDDGKEKICTVSSLRLDCVLATAFNLSRNLSSEFIGTGRVSVNGLPTEKGDRVLLCGDRISVRGKGRAEIVSLGRLTSKGRTVITVRIFG